MRTFSRKTMSEQNGQGENFPRFMGQSYVAHMINVAIALCPQNTSPLELDVGK